MFKITPSVQMINPLTLRERVDMFLETQSNFQNEPMLHRLESFKTDLLHKIITEGLTDDNLLLGLELNNYIRQLNNPNCRLERISYNIGK